MAEPEGKTTYKWRPKRCRKCGRRDRKNCHISTRGLCPRCAMENMGTSHEQMRKGSGEIAAKYQRNRTRGMIEYAERLRNSA